MKKVTLLNKASSGKTKIWSIWTEGNEVVREWGLEDGQKQITRDVVKGKNIGKANETSPEEQAELEAERILKKKREEGYSETLKSITSDDINWDNGDLPDSFAPSKPATSIDDADEEELLKQENAWYTRKFNGMRAFCVVANKGVRIFSRKLEDKTANFPHHVADLEKLSPGTILDCEFILNDDPDLIKEVFGAQPDKAIQRQNTTHGIPKAMVFDVLYTNEKFCDKTYVERFNLLSSEILNEDKLEHFEQVKILNKPGQRFKAPKDWEGLILADGQSKMKIRFDGKVDRKSGLYKKKNFKECDVVAYEWETGKGKNNDRPAKLLVGAYDENGKLVPISEVGSGLCESHKDEILTGVIKLPVAIELKYEEITPDKSFRLPIFLRWRQDKPVKECVLSDIKGYFDEE